MSCQVFDLSSMIGKKWTIVLLQQIELHGDKGFNFIEKQMKVITPKVLSQRMKTLEATGIIEKKVREQHPKRTVYQLTKKGSELQEIIKKMRVWNEKNQNVIACRKKECVACENFLETKNTQHL